MNDSHAHPHAGFLNQSVSSNSTRRYTYTFVGCFASYSVLAFGQQRAFSPLLAFVILLLLAPFSSFAQTEIDVAGSRTTDSLANARQLTLEEVVQLALKRSPSALLAETRKEIAYWRWRSYRSNYRPQLALRGTLPNFNRTNRAVEQNDGSFAFRRVSNNLTDIALRASQSIGLTGTRIFMSSGVDRFERFRFGCHYL